jgi:hypothetical protein
MANKILLQSIALATAGGVLESKFLPDNLVLSEPSPVLQLPRAYAFIIIIHGFMLTWLLSLGMSVGAARAKYMNLAKKDGEKDAESRYALPNLYVEGNTKHARAFNCVQRSHQQVFETLHMYLFCSMVAGICFPLTVTVACSIWFWSRMKWADGYSKSEGDASKRYSNAGSGLFWRMTLVLLCLSFATAAQLLIK